MSIFELRRDEAFDARKELIKEVNSILPKGDENSEEAKAIHEKVEVYCKLTGYLYTVITHDQIVDLLEEYKRIYNIID